MFPEPEAIDTESGFGIDPKVMLSNIAIATVMPIDLNGIIPSVKYRFSDIDVGYDC